VHTQQTTLEKEHAALLAGQAHAADGWAGLRMLDTGVARDVSGVVRWARKEGDTFDSESGNSRWEDREMLYWVGADGGVKVFERGTA
jgi:elongator complex protein 6